MDTLTTFMAYAADFELTYIDDDWERVRNHFAEGIVYEVMAESFGCKLIGREAIAAGLKKSLDGFDRRFDSREVELVGEPQIDGEVLRAAWNVHYTKAGCDPFTLRGSSTVRCVDGKVMHLTDAYERSAEDEFAGWRRANDLDVDPSYT